MTKRIFKIPGELFKMLRWLAIPLELRKVDRWLAWRMFDGKNKCPVDARGYRLKGWQKPPWLSYSEASGRAEKVGGAVGFVLGDGFGGIDLDNCCTESGELDPRAERIINFAAGAYAEVSPSGKGLKIFGRGDGWLEFNFAGKEVVTVTRKKQTTKSYFTVTGDVYRTGGIVDLPLDTLEKSGPSAKTETRSSQHGVMHSEACRLRGQLGKTEDEMFEIMQVFQKEHCPDIDPKNPWKPGDIRTLVHSVAKKYPAGKSEVASERARRVVLEDATTAVPERVRWMWENRIPLGGLTLLAGREASGKSTLAYERAARVTRGDLPGDISKKPRGVVIVATEDSWTHTVIPRLIAAGADLSRIFRASVEVDAVGVGWLSLPGDLPDLEAKAIERDVALVILDPLMSRIGTKRDGHEIDTHKDSDVRVALEPILGFGERTGATILGIIHVNKTATSDPLTSVMGSRAFSAVARAVLYVIREGEDRLLCFPKSNLGPEVSSIRFGIKSATLDARDPKDNSEITTSQIVWKGDDVRSASDVLADQASTKKTGPKERAIKFLRSRLSKEPTDSKTVKEEAREGGISERSLQRARRELGVVIEQSGFPARSTWSIRDEGGDDL